jgi:flagellar FliJ protein
LAAYEVESRQQRLAEIASRLVQLEMGLALLYAEGEAEALRAKEGAEAGWYHVGYAEGLRARKAAIQAQVDATLAEERGARDALAQAFEEQKKYEQVAESLRIAAVKAGARRETAELDEVGMRAVMRR